MIARMIASEGYQVWWDADLPPHMSYGDVITAKIGAAKAAVVVWSETAAVSEWVRAEADVARNQRKLIQTSLDDVMPPLPFNQIQCASLADWNGEPDHPGWNKVKQSLVALCGARGAEDSGGVSATPSDVASAAAMTPPPPPPPAPAPTPAPPQSTSNVPLYAGVGVAMVAVIAALLIVFVGLDRSTPPEVTLADAEEAAADADKETAEEDSAAEAEEAEQPPEPEPVPDRREWMFATVEDSDGFSNVRASPTMRSAIVGTVREGETFSTWRQESSWWQVELSDGTRGFIYRRLIRLLGSDSALTPDSFSQVRVDANGMVFSDSSSRLLTPSDVAGLNAGSLRLARNEIFARLGFRFEDVALRSYFSRFDWYSPRYSSVTLNAIEEQNVALIRAAEARLGR